MKIHLEIFREPSRVSLGPYDETNHDVRAILVDICEALDKPVPSVRFEVEGFGDPLWPVSVAVDLPVLLEQLPAAICGLSHGRLVEVDFYEQGVERRLIFEPEEFAYSVTCESDSDWRPEPRIEVVSRKDALGMFRKVRDDFLSVAAVVWPASVGHPWLVRWAEGQEEA